MKNLFLLSAFAVSLMSFKSEDVVLYDCANFASVVMAIQENINGCLSTEEYNAGWITAYGMCEAVN